jgi:hypothetical protein
MWAICYSIRMRVYCALAHETVGSGKSPSMDGWLSRSPASNLTTMMPTTVQKGTPSIIWKVQVERASAEYVTYWLIVTNLTSVEVSFEGRYSILSRY